MPLLVLEESWTTMSDLVPESEAMLGTKDIGKINIRRIYCISHVFKKKHVRNVI